MVCTEGAGVLRGWVVVCIEGVEGDLYWGGGWWSVLRGCRVVSVEGAGVLRGWLVVCIEGVEGGLY